MAQMPEDRTRIDADQADKHGFSEFIRNRVLGFGLQRSPRLETARPQARRLPAVMRALELEAYDGPLRLVEKPVPRPGPGEVLIRMAAAPINPSDLAFLRGVYGVSKPLPAVPGFEGSGRVVGAGPGWLPRLWSGRRVACVASPEGDGTWAEYTVTRATSCLPLLKSVSLEQGAMALVNPMTAWALLDIARRGRHKAIANTAAASALGRMMLRLGMRFDLPMVHIVRRQAQVALLRSLGAAHVLNSSDPDFDAQLRETFHRLGVTLAFDAVAGDMSGRLLAAMPRGGRVMVYGGLSESACLAHPGQLIFEHKGIDGFWLSGWLSKLGVVGLLKTALSVQRLLPSDLQTPVQARVSLEEGPAGLETYRRQMTQGKVLIVP